MSRKILITIWREDVAPRFDLSSEALIVELNDDGSPARRKTLVLPTVSAEELCQLILTEGVDLVVCGGIEQEYYDFLNWKNISVVDSVIGPYELALELSIAGRLGEGTNLFRRRTRKEGP